MRFWRFAVEHIAVFFVLLAAAAIVLGLLFFSFKLLKKIQQQEKKERGNQTAVYQLHPKLKKEQEPEPLSAYEACVLKESAKIHELIAEAQKEVKK